MDLKDALNRTDLLWLVTEEVKEDERITLKDHYMFIGEIENSRHKIW